MFVYTTENHKVHAANKKQFLKVRVFTSTVTLLPLYCGFE
jgi:hypothetical protein